MRRESEGGGIRSTGREEGTTWEYVAPFPGSHIKPGPLSQLSPSRLCECGEACQVWESGPTYLSRKVQYARVKLWIPRNQWPRLRAGTHSSPTKPTRHVVCHCRRRFLNFGQASSQPCLRSVKEARSIQFLPRYLAEKVFGKAFVSVKPVSSFKYHYSMSGQIKCPRYEFCRNNFVGQSNLVTSISSAYRSPASSILAFLSLPVQSYQLQP